jgi:hypothetical protein
MSLVVAGGGVAGTRGLRSPSPGRAAILTLRLRARSCRVDRGGQHLHEFAPTRADADGTAISGRPTSVNGQLIDEFTATGSAEAPH